MRRNSSKIVALVHLLFFFLYVCVWCVWCVTRRLLQKKKKFGYFFFHSLLQQTTTHSSINSLFLCVGHFCSNYLLWSLYRLLGLTDHNSKISKCCFLFICCCWILTVFLVKRRNGESVNKESFQKIFKIRLSQYTSCYYFLFNVSPSHRSLSLSLFMKALIRAHKIDFWKKTLIKEMTTNCQWVEDTNQKIVSGEKIFKGGERDFVLLI